MAFFIGMKRRTLKAVLVTAAFFIACLCTPENTFADTSIVEVIGSVYEFDKNSNYGITEETGYMPTRHDNTYGKCSIQAKMADITEQDGIMSIGIKSPSVGFCYTYGNEELYETDEYGEWTLADDSGKKVDDIKLDSKIGKGVIIIQSSADGWNWQTEFTETDTFEKTPYRADPVFTANAEQFAQGCYYRIIVAYKEQNLTDSKQVLWFDVKDYDYRKKAEIYEFYLFDAGIEEEQEADPEQPKGTVSLGSVTKADGPGYVADKGIETNDPHYGWDLGAFSITGFSGQTEEDGTPVFIKNDGDQIKLSFRLEQDIDKLNGKDSLKVEADREGSDTYFDIYETDFGRGALIIRKTDSAEAAASPAVYSGFLEANARLDTDVEIQAFEEGDYEVALDYLVKEEKNGGFFFFRPAESKDHYYSIFFRFSVRNGNCEIFPIESDTGRALTDRCLTETGFRLDLSRSRFLDVSVKRVVLSKGEDGWTSDIMFDRAATEGEDYSEEGFYTITAKNSYTGQETSIRIYVGTDPLLKAHVVTGRPLSDIEELVASGATIKEDGTMDLSGIEVRKEAAARGRTAALVISLVAVLILILAAIFVFLRKRKKD